MMKIEQLQIRNDNVWDILSSNDVYLVRFSKSRSTKSKEWKMTPYGLSFKNLGNASISEVVKLLESKEGAVVRVTIEES